MVSSQIVLSDLDTLNNLSTSIYDQISSIENSWQGPSKNTHIPAAEEIISTHKETLLKQLSSFADALDMYEKSKQLKQTLNHYQSQFQKATNNSESAMANYYASETEKTRQLLNNQNNEIRELLSSITSANLPDVAALNLVTFSHRGEFVNYYQYNYKESYGYGTTIASSGCGPTSMAMVLSAVTGEEVTPVEAANWSLEHGHRIQGNGTAWAYFQDMADAYGVECERMGVSKENIISNLSEGKYIIASVAPGHFTSFGHFIVLTGITEDGKITVADPNSEKRSNQTWDLNIFLNEGRQLWAM